VTDSAEQYRGSGVETQDAARSMELWFPEYAFDADASVSADQIPPLTLKRLSMHFGEGDPAEQLRRASDLLFKLSGEDVQSTVALYLCGYPKETIDSIAIVELDQALQQLEKALNPTVTAVPSKKLARQAMLSVVTAPLAIDTFIDDELQDDTPLEEGILRTTSERDEDISEQLRQVRLTSSDPVKDWLRLIGRSPLLTAEQEVTLAQEIEAGLFAGERAELHEASLSPKEKRELLSLQRQGERAFKKMVESNLRLVVSIAKHHVGRGLDFLDLIQEGNIGLIHGIRKFDYQQGNKVSTYVSWWIKQSISRAIADQARTIRIPVHSQEVLAKIVKSRQLLQAELGRDATLEEIAADIDVNIEKVALLVRSSQNVTSINVKLGDDQEAEFGDLIADVDAVDPMSAMELHYQSEDISELIGTLSEEKQELMVLHFGLNGHEPMGVAAIAEKRGVKTSTVSQMLKRAKDDLKQHVYKSGHLHHYFDSEKIEPYADSEELPPKSLYS